MSAALDPLSRGPAPVSPPRFYTQSGLDLPSLQYPISQQRSTLATLGSSPMSGTDSGSASTGGHLPHGHYYGLYPAGTQYASESIRELLFPGRASGSTSAPSGPSGSAYPTLQRTETTAMHPAIAGYYAGTYTWPPVATAGPAPHHSGYAGEASLGDALSEVGVEQMMQERRPRYY